MRKVICCLISFSLFFLGCSKDEFQILEETSVDVTVKVIDARCKDIILEIQNRNLKKLGDKKFFHNGKEYNGAIYINAIQCLPQSFLKNIYNNGVVNKTSEFKIKITKIPGNQVCEIFSCLAGFDNVPRSSYFIAPN